VRGKARNPNIEIRKKSERLEILKTARRVFFHFSAFTHLEFLSDFDIRISDFPP